MYSRDRLKKKEIQNIVANVLCLRKEDIDVIEKNEDWGKKDKTPIIIVYQCYLDDDLEDKYYKYHYYDIWYDDIKYKDKFKNLEKAFSVEVIIEME